MQTTIIGHYHLCVLVLFGINLLFHLIICPPPLVLCPIHSKYARGTMNECYWRNVLKANINYMVLRMNLIRMYLIVEEVFRTIHCLWLGKCHQVHVKYSQSVTGNN